MLVQLTQVYNENKNRGRSCYHIFSLDNSCSKSSENNLAYIKVKDSEYVYPLDKDAVLEFQGEKGKSVLEIKNGTIRFVESTCYDSTCIKMGEAGENKAKYLACLPNMVIVTIKGETSGKKTGSEVLDEY